MEAFRRTAVRLAAAGSAVSEDGYHLFYLKDGNKLEEEVWDTIKVQQRTQVSDDVRANAPVACVVDLDGDQDESQERSAFSVDTQGHLKYFVFDHDYGQWDRGDFGGASNTKVHRESKLAATIDGKVINVFFLNESGKIQSVVRGGSGWRAGDLLSTAQPRAGTPLFGIAEGDKILLFYFSSDNLMHYHKKTSSTGAWTDHVWETVRVEAPVSSMRVVELDTDGLFEAWILVQGYMFRYAGRDERMRYGKVDGPKGFILDDESQADPQTKIEAGAKKAGFTK